MKNIKKFIKKFMPNIYLKISEIKYKIISITRAEKISISDNKKIFIILAADYGNFGDIAITYAQREFLNNILPDYEIVEIPANSFYNHYKFLKEYISDKDIITIAGGGFMGNLYEYAEEIRRITIKTFKNNLIISFPQTTVFTQDSFGKASLEKSKKIYKKHRNLILFAREEKSYNEMKRNFSHNKIYLVPDIVFYLKNKVAINKSDNNKVGICFRQDVEKLLDIDKKTLSMRLLNYGLEEISTTTTNDKINLEKKYDQLFELLTKISKVKVFITDRLHGMIFCYITKTPCISFDNANHKVKETYQKWLKDCSYIKLLNEKDITNIKDFIDEIYKKEKADLSFDKEFKIMEEIIKENMNKN